MCRGPGPKEVFYECTVATERDTETQRSRLRKAERQTDPERET